MPMVVLYRQATNTKVTSKRVGTYGLSLLLLKYLKYITRNQFYKSIPESFGIPGML